jgi:hypothetical protein
MLEIPTEFDNKFESAFKGGWEAIVWFCVGLVSIWLLVIVMVLVFIGIRFRLKSSKSKS